MSPDCEVLHKATIAVVFAAGTNAMIAGVIVKLPESVVRHHTRCSMLLPAVVTNHTHTSVDVPAVHVTVEGVARDSAVGNVSPAIGTGVITLPENAGTVAPAAVNVRVTCGANRSAGSDVVASYVTIGEVPIGTIVIGEVAPASVMVPALSPLSCVLGYA